MGMKKLLTACFVLVCTPLFAQNLTGYWYGVANVANGGSTSNYLMELILRQNGANVQGVVNYYFKNTYRSFKVNGAYNASSRKFLLQNIPITYFGSAYNMEVDCPMDLVAQHRVARAGSNLDGRLVSKGQYRNTCPEIIFDFRLNTDAGNQDSVLTALRLFKETKQVWTPSPTDTLVAATIIQRPVVNYAVSNEFTQRQKNVVEEIEVESDSLKVDFYDNGEVDGDSISIFFNDQLLASSQKLSARAIHTDIVLPSNKEVNELSMFANNLGSIPPNTALMTVWDGKKRYELRMSSNLQQNAVVRIRRKKR